MSRRSFLLDDDLWAYLAAHTEPPDLIASELIAETATLPMAGMQVAPEQGVFLKLLVQLTGARSVLEIGTFTGFSALCMARGLPEGGRLVACDVSEEWTSIGRRYWERAGVADRIELRLGPALDTLGAMAPDELYDLVFVDADKPGYPAYYEAVVDHIRTGGLLLADNVLRAGRILAPDSEGTAAIHRFNDLVHEDPRTEAVLLPLFDGLTFARKVS